MFAALESIGVKCQGPVPVGCLTHLYLVKCSDVVNDILPGLTLAPHGRMFIGPGKTITEIKLRSKTAQFTETLSQSSNGGSYACQITVPIPSLANEVVQWVHDHATRRFIAIFRDTAGNCYLAGTKSNGLRLGWSRSVEQMSSQVLLLAGINWHPVLWLDTVDPEVLFPSNKEFDFSFDISFS